MARAAAFLIVSLVSSQAWSGEEESKTFFAQGRQLRLDGNCADAIVSFKKALETFPDGLGSLRNVAECEESLARFASARRSYWDLRTAALKSAEPKYQGWDQYASERFAALAPRVPKLVVHARNAPASAAIRINGKPIDASLLDTPLEQDVGDVQVVLDDGSAVPPTKKLRLEEGKTYEVELVGPEPSADPEHTDPPAAGPTPPKTAPPDTGTSPLVIAGGVSFGAAGLSVGALIASVAVRQSALSTVEEACPTLTGCDPSLQGDVDRGQTASTLVSVFAVGAGVFAALGVGLTTAGVLSGGAEEPATALQLVPVASPDGGFIGLRGRFF